MTTPGDPDEPLTYETPAESKSSVPTDGSTEEEELPPSLEQAPEDTTPSVPREALDASLTPANARFLGEVRQDERRLRRRTRGTSAS